MHVYVWAGLHVGKYVFVCTSESQQSISSVILKNAVHFFWENSFIDL